MRARQRQLQRQGATNGRLEGRALDRICRVGAAAEALLARGTSRFGLSARAVARVLRVARTLADLEGATDIAKGHVAEALQLRGPDGAA